MKNIVKILVLPIMVLVLSGCSLNTSDTVLRVGSILQSLDNGRTWEVRNELDSEVNITDADILSISVNPQDANNIFFGTKSNGILRTDDGGTTLAPTNFISEKVYGLVLSPTDGRTIYASGVWQKRGKIFKSIDSGENWTEIYTAASEGPLVISMVIDRRNENVLYVSTSDNQVLKSVDAGQSWTNIFKAPAPVFQVAIDRGNSNLIYFNVMGNGIFRSSDGGNNAEDISPQVFASITGSREIKYIETDPSNAGWVYAVGGVGMIRSKDGGNTWEKMRVLDDPQTFPVTTLAINPENSREIIYGSAKAAYRSDDQGVSWTPFQLESLKTVKVLKYNLADSGMIFMGMGK